MKHFGCILCSWDFRICRGDKFRGKLNRLSRQPHTHTHTHTHRHNNWKFHLRPQLHIPVPTKFQAVQPAFTMGPLCLYMSVCVFELSVWICVWMCVVTSEWPVCSVACNEILSLAVRFIISIVFSQTIDFTCLWYHVLVMFCFPSYKNIFVISYCAISGTVMQGWI